MAHRQKIPPVGKICYYCGGSGKTKEMGIETCSTCHGSGRDFWSDCLSEPCRNCSGKGMVTYCRTITCLVCRGSGITY
jgi:DnaJ-class molecular chaperone